MAWYHVAPGGRLLWLPLFTALALLASFGISLWLSALNVKYRDFRYKGRLLPRRKNWPTYFLSQPAGAQRGGGEQEREGTLSSRRRRPTHLEIYREILASKMLPLVQES